MKKTDKQKYLTEKEYQAFLNSIKDEYLYTFFFLMGNLGLRVGEAIRLRRCDINLDEEYIKIPTLKQDGKKGINKGSIKQGELPATYIDIPIDDEISKILSNHIKRFNIKGQQWLFSNKNNHLPKWKAQRYFKKYAKKAGLDKVLSIHSLRHYRGVSAYKGLKDIRAVQLLLRHKNINSTQTYTTMDLDAKRELTNKLKIIKKEVAIWKI